MAKAGDGPRYALDLAGGSVVDVGYYAISAARLFPGEPQMDRSRANLVWSVPVNHNEM